MDFGKVPEADLDRIDFALPPEPLWNSNILKGSKVASPKVYVGCAKWGRKEWIGKLYPKGTKEAQFLDYYLEHYNSIELNATHYQTYPPETIRKWADKANGKEFLFSPKFPQSISHYSSFVNVDDRTNTFFNSITAFGKHLGPIFLQTSDRFSPKRKENVFAYLQSLPKDLQFFFEVRHQDWFGNEQEKNDLLNTLYNSNVGYIITDAAGRKDCVHMHLTVPKAFIRFVGNSLHDSDFKRIDDWVERIKYWLENGLEELYFFMHMHDEAFSPELSIYLIEQLNQKCGLTIHKPTFVEPEATVPKAVKPKKPTA